MIVLLPLYSRRPIAAPAADARPSDYYYGFVGAARGVAAGLLDDRRATRSRYRPLMPLGVIAKLGFWIAGRDPMR